MTPHKCPVCMGNGQVPNGFYLQTTGNWSQSGITPEKCRTCNGTGIVWSGYNEVQENKPDIPIGKVGL